MTALVTLMELCLLMAAGWLIHRYLTQSRRQRVNNYFAVAESESGTMESITDDARLLPRRKFTKTFDSEEEYDEYKDESRPPEVTLNLMTMDLEAQIEEMEIKQKYRQRLVHERAKITT